MSISRRMGYSGAIAQGGSARYVSSAASPTSISLTGSINANAAVSRPFNFAAPTSTTYRSSSPTMARSTIPTIRSQTLQTSVKEAPQIAAVVQAPAASAPATVKASTVAVPLGAAVRATQPAAALRGPRLSLPVTSQRLQASAPSQAIRSLAGSAMVAAGRPAATSANLLEKNLIAGGVVVLQQKISRQELIASGRLILSGEAPSRDIDRSRILAPQAGTLIPQQVPLSEQEQLMLSEYMIPQEVAGTISQPSRAANGSSDVVLQEEVGQVIANTEAQYEDVAAAQPVISAAQAATSVPDAQAEAVQPATVIPDPAGPPEAPRAKGLAGRLAAAGFKM